MSKKLEYIMKLLDEYLEEYDFCDEQELKQLEKILKRIEYVINYCYLGDQ
uniref:Uncharacterized protein n=1 Tax=Sulfolobus islandicus rod-shaped virus 1 TaxID=157898 RepID=Q5W369_SIRV1|nr:hypothetical protein [Sulfolobus islandicus rod-shaped virus 1]